MMYALTESNEKTPAKEKWILGPGCLPAVGRLWERYRLLFLQKYSESEGKNTPFEHLKLLSLGVPKTELTLSIPDSLPSVLADAKQLSSIEQTLVDQHGRPLQKILTDDIDSRVLIEIGQICPEASQIASEALDFIEKNLPWTSSLLHKLISWIVPIYHEKYGRPFRRGFSHINYLGIIFTTFAERSSQPEELRRTVMAIDLAHELGHQVFMLYQLADKITENPEAPVYSSVRKTERPTIMALHACMAAAYMIEICEAISRSPFAFKIERQFSLNSLSELLLHQKMGLNSLSTKSNFTQVGKLVISDLRKQVERIEKNFQHQKITPSELSYFGLLAP